MRSKGLGVIDREIMSGQKTKERDYWLNRLAGDLHNTAFPFDFHRKETTPPGQEHDTRHKEPGELKFLPDPSLLPGLMKICGGSDVRLHILLTAAIVVLVYKYTGSKDILTGSPIYKQDKAAGEEFVNSVLVFRHQFDPGVLDFKRFLAQTGKTVFEAVEHQNFPLETLIPRLSLAATTEGFPLFDIAVLLENIHDPAYFEHIQTNMTISFLRSGSNLHITWTYNPDRYRGDTVRQIACHFECLIKQLTSAAADRPHLSLRHLDILLPEEKEKLLVEWNDTRQFYPLDQTVCDLFLYQASSVEDRLALVCKGEDSGIPTAGLSYRELDRRAGLLALVLREKGVGPETISGVMTERSQDMIIAMLAILKAGGAYLPISPEYPDSRITFMLDDSGALALLTQRVLLESRDALRRHVSSRFVCYVDDPGLYRGKHPGFNHFANSGGLAYVIYTSGTTGKPKGVMIEHRSLTNLLYSMYWDFSGEIGPGDRCLSITNISFDVSVCELFLPLAFGAALVLLPEEKRFQLSALARAIIEEAITFTYIPPALLGGVYEHLKAFLNENCGCLPLDKLMSGAEPIVDTLLDNYSRLNPLVRIVNGYGPTETTVFSTTFQYQPGSPKGERISIGKPIGNTQVYIVDPGTNTQLHPPGVPGELLISGTGLARGYLNRPELTADKFVQAQSAWLEAGRKEKRFAGMNLVSFPASCELRAKGCFYKTGDLVYYDREGNLCFIGRIDRQIKIRGYRIEQGEIEERLLMHRAVKQTVIIDREDKSCEKYLCAYVVPVNRSSKLDSTRLRKYLAEFLPRYMVPRFFVIVERIPVTLNGKVDRAALPEPGAVGGANYAAPRSEMEKKIAAIWQEILNVDKVGIEDNFFDLGGNSMGIVRLNARLKEKFNREIPEVKILEHPTVATFARYLEGGAPANTSGGNKDPGRGRGIDRNKLKARNRRMKGDKECVRIV